MAFTLRRQPLGCLPWRLRAFYSTSTTATPPSDKPNAPPTQKRFSVGDLSDNPALAEAPRSHGPKVRDFIPQPLMRPIGMKAPPEAGQNSDKDKRSWQQKVEDFRDKEKHAEKKKQIIHELARPYFRDFSNIQHSEGKTFIAPPRLFKEELSLYFPNFHGRTLEQTNFQERDTTPVLEGKATVVSVYGSMWGEAQADTFVDPHFNETLHRTVEESGGKAQLVRINIESNKVKYWFLSRLFKGSLRRRRRPEDWNKYFMVRKRTSEEIRESIGLLNNSVAYTYLVDSKCKIRWAASGNSNEEEREGLVLGMRRLLKGMGVDLGPLRTQRRGPKGP